jgi:hypothetical protein
MTLAKHVFAGVMQFANAFKGTISKKNKPSVDISSQ